MIKIPLTQGKFAVIDDIDLENISQWKWFFDGRYARRYVRLGKYKYSKVRMHTAILGKQGVGLDIDHINGDPLDNRRGNLRICTHRQNVLNSKIRKNNTSGFRGISWIKSKNLWRVYLKLGKKQVYGGKFKDISQAVNSYNKLATKCFGEFVKLN